MTAKAKTTKLSRTHALIIGVVLAVLVLAIGFVWQSSMADEGAVTEPKLEIVAANVEYAESLHLYYGVDALLPEGVSRTNIKMLYFNAVPTAYTYEAASALFESGAAYQRGYYSVEDITSGGVTYQDCVLFSSEGISAKNMVDNVYAVAYIEYAGQKYYSAPLKYSVLQYVYDRRNENPTAAQKTLYTNTLEYGAAAQQVLGYETDRLATAEYKAIKIAGGKLADGYTRGLYLAGDEITVTPDTQPAQGQQFVIYAPNGAIASESYTFTVSENTASGTYTVAGKNTLVNFVGLAAKNGEENVASGTYLEPGTELALTANAAPGEYIRFHWDLGGVINVPSEAPAEGSFTATYTVPASREAITLSAVYATEEAQIPAVDFEDAPLLKASGTFINGYGYTIEGKQFFELTRINDATQKNPTNLAIHMNDNATDKGAGFYIKPVGIGKTTVVEFDLYVAESSSGLTSEYDIGTSYRMELNGSGQVLYLEDRHNPAEGGALRNDLGVELYYGSWNHFRVEYYPTLDGEGNVTAMNTVLKINGAPVSISSSNYKTIETAPVYLRLWSMTGTTLNCYYDNLKMFRTDYYELKASDITAMEDLGAFSFSVPNETTSWNNRYNMLKRLFLSDKFADANGVALKYEEENYETYAQMWNDRGLTDDAEIRKRFERATGNLVSDSLDYWSTDLFGPEVYTWLASLYDPETGGFYYSLSAKETYGYLPDMESTGQAGGLLGLFGSSLSSVFGDEEWAKLASWLQFRQSNEDGYFYHPQWGTDVGDSRLSRDLGKPTSYIPTYADGDYIFKHALKRLNADYDEYEPLAQGIAYAEPAPESAMTYRLGTSSAVMVSKIILASEVSDAHEHLSSVEALGAYLDNLWGAHATAKSIGHSYSFGNTVTSQNAQVKNAGPEFAETVINYLNAKQAEAQELILANAVELYEFYYGVEADEATVHALIDSDKGFTVPGLPAPIKYNGLWESGGVYFYAPEVKEGEDGYEAYRLYARVAAHKEKLAFTITSVGGETKSGYQMPVFNYNFVSGLLKISGIYNSLGYEMPFPEEALESAIAMMTDPAEHYKALGEAVVSVYNPPNAICNILTNINRYGDLAIRNAARAQLQANAVQIVETTMDKISVYECEDGGYSYGITNSAQSSQGEPAAYGNRKEGDVNGTALAIGARRAMLSALGLANIQVMPGFEVTLEDYPNIDANIDYDGDGVVEEKATHKDIFKYLIKQATVISKKDTTSAEVGDYTFDEGDVPANSSDPDKNNHVVEFVTTTDKNGEENRVVYMQDNESGTGLTVYFDKLRKEAATPYYEFHADMKYTTVGDLQLYLSKLKLQISTGNGYVETQGRTSGDKQQENNASFGEAINAKEWFTLNVCVYPEGTTYNDETVYAVLTLTQGSTVVTDVYKAFAEGGWEPAELTSVRFYTTYSSEADIYIDNVGCYQYGAISNGDYDFDQESVRNDLLNSGITGGTIVEDDVFDYANMAGEEATNYWLKVNGASSTFKTGIVGGAFDYNEVQFSMMLKDAENGNTGLITLKDGAGKAITAVRYTVSNVVAATAETPKTATITFTFEKSGQTLLVINNVDLSGLVDVRFELHYDLDKETGAVTGSKRLDIVTRFKTTATDAEGKPEYYDADGEYMTGVVLTDDAADVTNFANVTFDVTGTVYLDDVYVRNVLLEFHK